MKDNWNLQVIGNKVILVPYREYFVDKYHRFMNDEKILELTASEPLTIDEEYEMQKTWYNDTKKCTFIILSKDMSKDDEEMRNNHIDIERIEIKYMAGDVNLFLHDIDDPFNAEIEIMIAEPDYRGKGFATEALYLIMYYGFTKLGIRRFFAKISDTNVASIKLFEKIGYVKANYSVVWKEIEYEFLTSYTDDDDDNKKVIIQKNRDSVAANIDGAIWTTYN